MYSLPLSLFSFCPSCYFFISPFFDPLSIPSPSSFLLSFPHALSSHLLPSPPPPYHCLLPSTRMRTRARRSSVWRKRSSSWPGAARVSSSSCRRASMTTSPPTSPFTSPGRPAAGCRSPLASRVGFSYNFLWGYIFLYLILSCGCFFLLVCNFHVFLFISFCLLS